MSAFHFVMPAQEIIFGEGSVAQLAGAVDRLGWQRLMVCASPSQRRNGHLDLLEAKLGSRLVATYDCVLPHVQAHQLAEASAVAASCGAEAIIGLGGGSPIGMAKAVSLALEVQRTIDAHPVIAIPTTYAGSEMTPVYGVTHAGSPPRKVTVRDPRITPRLVVYDPELTLDLPRELTAATGINALAHCVEALYSIGRQPLATAAARSGIEHIARSLQACTENGADHTARADMLIGSHLAGLALSLTQMGLHHGLCHVLGGSAGVPHGYANCIVLPHAMAYNADAVAPELAQAGQAMGIPGSGQASDEDAARQAVDGVYQFISRLGLPQRLRDVGVDEGDLPRLAALALESRAVQDNPKPIADATQLEALLRAAW